MTKVVKKIIKKVKKKGGQGKGRKFKSKIVTSDPIMDIHITADRDERSGLSLRDFCNLDDMDESMSFSNDSLGGQVEGEGNGEGEGGAFDVMLKKDDSILDDFIRKTDEEGVEKVGDNNDYNNNDDNEFNNNNDDENNVIEINDVLDTLDDNHDTNGDDDMKVTAADILIFTDINVGENGNENEKNIDIEVLKFRDENYLENIEKNVDRVALSDGNGEAGVRVGSDGEGGDSKNNHNYNNCDSSICNIDDNINGKKNQKNDNCYENYDVESNENNCDGKGNNKKCLSHLNPNPKSDPIHSLVIINGNFSLLDSPNLLLSPSASNIPPPLHSSQGNILPFQAQIDISPLGSTGPLIPGVSTISMGPTAMENCHLPHIQSVFESINIPTSLCQCQPVSATNGYNHICNKCKDEIISDHINDSAIHYAKIDANCTNMTHSKSGNSLIDDGYNTNNQADKRISDQNQNHSAHGPPHVNNEISYGSSSSDSEDCHHVNETEVVEVEEFDIEIDINR